jgi:hypothetical protein
MRCSLTSAVYSLASRLPCNIRDAYSLDYSCFCIASTPLLRSADPMTEP